MTPPKPRPGGDELLRVAKAALDAGRTTGADELVLTIDNDERARVTVTYRRNRRDLEDAETERDDERLEVKVGGGSSGRVELAGPASVFEGSS